MVRGKAQGKSADVVVLLRLGPGSRADPVQPSPDGTPATSPRQPPVGLMVEFISPTVNHTR